MRAQNNNSSFYYDERFMHKLIQGWTISRSLQGRFVARVED